MADDHDKLAKGDNAGSAGAPGAQASPQSIWDIVGKKIQDASGDLTNQVVGAAAHIDLGQKYSEQINAPLAREYIKGRTVIEQRQAQGIAAADMAGLSAEEATAVRAYQKVHSDLPAKIPFVDRAALVREVERNIEIKAKSAATPPPPNKPEMPATKTSPAAFETSSGQKTMVEDRQIRVAGVHNGADALPKDSTKSSSQDSTRPSQQNSNRPSQPDSTRPSQPDLSRSLAKPVPNPTNDLSHHETAGLVSREKAERSLSAAHKPPSEAHKPPDTTAPRRQADLSQSWAKGQPKAPARPYEPEARELKTSAPATSTDAARVQRVLPEPHPTAAKIANKENETVIAKTINQSRGLTPSDIGSADLSRATNDGPLVPESSRSAIFARQISASDKNPTQEIKTTGSPLAVPVERVTRLVNVTDSKLFQATVLSKVLSFGRRLDRVEKALIELSSHVPVQQSQEESAGKSVAVTSLPQSHSVIDSSETGESLTNKDSHAISESNETVELHPTSEIHSADETHDTGGIFSTSEILEADETHDTSGIFSAGKTAEPAGCAVKSYIVRGIIPDKRYITGGELAFVAIMALASASRVRPGEHAAEQGLSQTRREFVLVEEEPWLSPDYQLPSDPSKAGTTLVDVDQIASSEDKVTSGETKKTESQTSSASPEKAKGLQQRKILLRPQIMVQEGDNLSQMAEALFNDSRLGHLIADLNAKTIDQNYSGKTRIVRLTTRQRLSLPVYQDIMQFEATELSRVGDWDLITIVESTALDKELLDDQLSGMLGINSKNRDPLV